MKFALGPGRRIIEEYVRAGKVRFVYRHLTIIGPESLLAAIASECAAEQGKFWEYHDLLFQRWVGENVGGFSEPNLLRFATEVGLDAGPFTSCLQERRYAEKVRRDFDDARALGVRSTPTLFISGKMYPGLREFDEYRRIIEGELAAAP